MRSIAVVTVARSDYGIYGSLLHALSADRSLELRVIAAGMHLSPEFGSTVEQIEADGFPVFERIEMLLSSDTPLGTAKSIGLGVIGFAEAFTRSRPDIVVVLGDRFEMHAAALATLPLGIPLAHIHGGEVTEGAIDDALRHGISKIAHLHFASTQAYADRLVRMGEEPWRVTVSGAPSLDRLDDATFMSPAQLHARFGVSFDPAPLLVTFHPVTKEWADAPNQIGALLRALEDVDVPTIFTMPNADATGRLIAQEIRAFAAGRPQVSWIDNFGPEGYFSALNAARAMVGNSSSGIIEAPSFRLPVVNIGSRQDGRIRAGNVIDVPDPLDVAGIKAAIARALDPTFPASLTTLESPYRRGNAAQIILDRLRRVPLDARLVKKHFYDG